MPKMMVVAITKIRTDDTMTSFFSLSKESLILATSPKAMAPLIKAAYEMNVSSPQFKWLLSPALALEQQENKK